MSRFSERMGHRPVREIIQREVVDEATRNRLWDVVWSCLDEDSEMRFSSRRNFYLRTWISIFEKPVDKFPDWTTSVNNGLRKRFFDGSWFEMYDILEWACVQADPDDTTAQQYANHVLEDYLCAYRFVGDDLVEMTGAQDIAAVEAALGHPLDGVRAHLAKALSLLGDRTAPDVENCIKEAVSAVESLCSAIVGSRATLGSALKALEDNGVSVHAALKRGWGSIYGWTSDADGIRHAMQSSPDLRIDDAVYMLVSCSAFVALLTEKALRAGIELQPVGT